METTIKDLKQGDYFLYNGEKYVLNQTGTTDAHCVCLNSPENSLSNLNLILHNSTRVKRLFKIGDYVRLGNDIPFQIISEMGIDTANSAPYRLAIGKEIELAKLYALYKKNQAKWDDVLSMWKSLRD